MSRTAKPKPRSAGRESAPAKLYDGIAARASAHILEASRKGRDIAPAPKVENRKRRDAAAGCLRTFLETYFPGTFALAWSDDHLKALARLEAVVAGGGQYALAMPRGSGKTSIVERAALWAVLTGRRRFVLIAAANESLAEQSLGRLKAELEHNALLLADWPKAVYPIRRLESQARRCVGQLYEGERTCITWQRKRLVLPTMPGPDNEASGAVLHVAGLTGAVRGLSHVDVAGRTIRPDLLLVDDPQDRDSARSVIQTAERLALLNGDLLGLAGPGQRIAALATVTVIHPHDLAAQLLDDAKNAAWQGERFKLVYQWASRADLWDEYAKLRAEGFRPGGDRGEGATDFYRRHRADMDAGAIVAWPARYEPGELSALQHAYNLRLDRGDLAFLAEYQNEPPDDAKLVDALDPVAIAGRCGGFERGIAPPECEKLTAFIDVGQSLLWWMMCGWDESFGCSILDYGCWPEQRARVFAARNASPTLEESYPQAGGSEGAIYSGLSALVGKLFGREWTRSDGATIPLARCLIDAGWATDVVRLFIRQSEHRERLTPSKGVGIGPAQVPIIDYRKRPGERIGDGWILGTAGPDRLRLLRFDANHWKTRLAGMLTRSMGARGGVTLYGQRAIDHELLALHLASEYPTRMEGKGRALDVWARRPDRDNHLWDTLIGASVAASVEGLSPLASVGGNPVIKKRAYVTIAELKSRGQANNRLAAGMI
jgi:hypothetical protein